METGNHLLQQLRNFNLFYEGAAQNESNEETLRNQLRSTRLYVVLLTMSSLTLMIFTYLSPLSKLVIVRKPSLETFLQLYASYPHTLSCPCQTIGIPYKDFISIEPDYHQMCSSDLISSKWIKSLFRPEFARMTPLDFRVTAATQFRLFLMACSASIVSINNMNKIFAEEQLTSIRALSPQYLLDQASVLLDKFNAMMNVRVSSLDGLQVLHFIIAFDFTTSALHSNAFITSRPGSNDFQRTFNYYPKYANSSNSSRDGSDFYFCDTFGAVTYKAGIYNWALEQRPLAEMMIPQPAPVFVIPGMSVGCYADVAMDYSTLECFYDAACLNATAMWISTLPPESWPKPLNSSAKSQYSPTTQFAKMFQNQMVENWHIKTNFSSYYASCAPAMCTYTLIQRGNILHMVTKFIGSIGGLMVVLRLIVPNIIKFQANVFSSRARGRKSVPHEPAQQTTWSTRFIQMVRLVRARLHVLNIFDDTSNDQRIGVLATRAYIILVAIGGVALAFYLFFAINTVTFTLPHPSRDAFTRLYNSYSLTLTCPCAQAAIPYSQLTTAYPLRLHQICSTAFISPLWLTAYFQIRFLNGTQGNVSLSNSDFRQVGQNKFLAYALFCHWSYSTIQNGQRVFFNDTFLSINALSEAEFQARVDSAIASFQKQTFDNMGSWMALLQLAVVASGIESGFKYQPVLYNNSWNIFHISPPPSAFNVCACSVAPECLVNTAGFDCVLGNNCTAGTRVWTIPGFFLACTHFQSILVSDLRCFYDRDCLNKILAMYNVDMPDRLPLPAVTSSIPTLNSLAPSRFLPNDTLQTLFSHLMVEDWRIQADFDGYYKACAPATCTYSVSQRMNMIDLITTIVGLIGGLTVSVRLLIGLAIYAFSMATHHWQNRRHADRDHRPEINVAPAGGSLFSGFKTFRDWLSKLNLFLKESSVCQMENAHHMAVVASRIYVVIFITCILILVFFNALSTTTVVVNVPSPSLETYEKLLEQYSTELSCPCKQITTNYGNLLTLTVSLHQVCSSAFITPLWTTSLYGYGADVQVYLQADRPFLSKQHQILGMLCEAAESTINTSLASFNSKKLTTTLILSRASFISQIDTIINQFIDQVPLDFQRIITFAHELFQTNLIPTAFNTDWFIKYGNASKDYLLESVPRLYSNGTCNCVVSSTCQEPLRVGPSEVILPGLVVSCWPLNALRLSTTECFFSSNCINTILTYLHYYTQPDGSPPANFTPPSEMPLKIDPLDNSSHSRFPSNTSIGQLIDELFIESWQKIRPYETYFNSCAPSLCRYEYTTRNSALFVATSLLALYGGLTVCLRLVVWNAVQLNQWVRSYRRTHRTIFVVSPGSA